MKKVMRTIMPAHPGGSITVEQAMEAFRAVRRDAQKAEADRAATESTVPGSRSKIGKNSTTA